MSNAEALRMFRIAYYDYDKKDVAINSGISCDYLSKLEQGFRPITSNIIRKLAGFYNVGTVGLTRLFRELDIYDISKPKDYQKALIKISTFFLENQLTVN